jgi:hypothetical protein
VSSLESLIDVASAEDSSLTRQIFGSEESVDIAEQIEDFFLLHFGERPSVLFYRQSVGVVIGARVGGQSVVLKIHHWRSSVDGLRAIQRVQGELCGLGIPVPQPLLQPTPFGTGIATVEALLAGDLVDGRRAETRRILAQELFRFLEGGHRVTDTSGIEGPALLSVPKATLWPAPHSSRFDFGATEDGSEWIDELALSARQELEFDDSDRVIGHLDWRVGNTGFRGAEMTAIYDMDSVGLASEAFVVGCAAATFSTDWNKPNGALPSVPEMMDFVDEYEQARSKPFDAGELEVIDAANLLIISYGARCQHSLSQPATESSPPKSEGWITLLKERVVHGPFTS